MPSSIRVWNGETWQAPGESLRHILVMGDSISYGSGSSAPKQDNSWPGVLRTALNAAHGRTGTGLVLFNNDLIPSNLAWDGRVSIDGSVTEQAAGWYRSADWRSAAGARVTIAETGSEAILYLLAQSTGVGRVSVDGGTARSFQVSAATADIAKEPGYHAGHVVIRVPLGADTVHTVEVWGDGTSLDLLGWEFRTNDRSGWVVSAAAISGKGMGGLVTSDETNGTYGFPLAETAMKELNGICVLALETNEWTGTATPTQVKNNLHAALARLDGRGYRIVVMVPPQPNPTVQGGTMTYTQLVTAVSEQATVDGVEFLSLQKLWAGDATTEAGMFAAGNASGYFADQIHPSDTGAASIAAAVRAHLGV